MEKLKQYIIGANASIFQKIDPDTNIKVFTPTNDVEIKMAIDFAKENKLPITSKGGGSGMSGACTGSSRDKVVISAMRLKKVHEIRTAIRCQNISRSRASSLGRYGEVYEQECAWHIRSTGYD